VKVILPSAGYATRLYPLTENMPKCLLKVGNKRMIEYVIDKVLELNVDEIIIISNAKFYQQFLDWKNQFYCNIPIRILNDNTSSNETRLGWVGDVNFAIKMENIEDDCLFVSTDNLFTFSIQEINRIFKEKGRDIIALYDVKDIEQARHLGVVSVGEDNKIIEFAEKPDSPKSTLCSTGIYFYTRETVKLIDKYLKLGHNPDRPGDFLEWLINQREILAYTFDSEQVKWHDIGSLEALHKAEEVYRK